MLPPGHIAAGYLVSKIFLNIAQPPLSLSEQDTLIVWGMFFGFAPDLDFFNVFRKTKSLIMSDEVSHRKQFSHAPIVWLAVGLAVSSLGMIMGDVFIQYFGLILWFGSWSHFALDSIQHGIMWLWPWNMRFFALRDREVKTNLKPDKFVAYWFSFLRFYATKIKLSFYLEMLIIVTALLTYFGIL